MHYKILVLKNTERIKFAAAERVPGIKAKDVFLLYSLVCFFMEAILFTESI